MPFCGNCGTPVNNYQVICPKCNKSLVNSHKERKIQTSTISTKETVTVNQDNAHIDLEKIMAEPIDSYDEPAESVEELLKRISKLKTIKEEVNRYDRVANRAYQKKMDDNRNDLLTASSFVFPAYLVLSNTKKQKQREAVNKDLSDAENLRREAVESKIRLIDEAIDNEIKSYVIESDKSKIWDFFNIAIDKSQYRRTPEEKAWWAKTEQTYSQARVVFGDDPLFIEVERIYSSKNEEVKKRKKNQIITICCVSVVVLFLIILWIVSMTY